MATLTGKTPAQTYKDLLQVSNGNTGIDGTLRTVSDGEGTSSPLKLSSSQVSINGLIYPTADGTASQFLKTDGAGNLSFATVSLSYAIDDLSDVTITSVASGELLKYDGAAWVNNTLAEAGISAVGHTHVAADVTDLASAAIAFTNKSGAISQWTNDSSYTTLADVAAVGYITASSSDNLTNKTGNISQWTNDSAYITTAGVPVPTTITVDNEATDTTCFLGFFTAATGNLAPKTNANLTLNSSTGVLTASAGIIANLTGDVTGTADDAVTTQYLQSTGVLSGGTISIGTGGAGVATTITIAAGTGQIVDNSTSPPTITPVSWSTKTDVAITDIATQQITFFGIDSAGNVVQQGTDFTPSEFRQYIEIGIAVHSNLTTVNAVNQMQAVAYNALNQFQDLTYGLDLFNISGNIFSANGANLSLDKSAGEIFRQGGNYSSPTTNPHVVTTGALSPVSLRMQNQSGAAGASVTVIDVDNYDVGGTTTSVPANKFTILRVYLFQSNLVAVTRGQTVYNSLAEAKAGVQTEDVVLAPAIAANGLLRGFICVRQGTTDLTDPADAFFIAAGKFGGSTGVGGLSVSTLQNVYDNSSTPEITTDSTRGALTVKRGSAADTDPIIEGLNAAGSTTSSVTGAGVITATSFVGPLTGNADTVTTNANLTGPITSVGNATSIASQTGTGTKFVVDTSPTLVTPNIGVATATSVNKVALTAPATGSTLTIADGQTLTVNGSATITNGTHSGTNTGDQSLFSTIAVSGQSDVVADSTTDTLTLAAGANITITTNATTDTITIAGTGGATLGDGDYGDITVSAAGTVMTIDNDVVTYAKMQNVSATDKLLGRSTAGAGDVEEIACTAAGRALIDDATAADQRTTLGLGTIATQASSNVSITGGSVTGITDITVADGGTGVSTMTTAYAPVCAGTTATGALQVADTGLSTAGYVLTSNGASALPSFQAAAGGGDYVFISSSTASNSASISFTGLSSTYSVYVVELIDVVPATDAVALWMRTSTDNGSTYDSTAGHYAWVVTSTEGNEDPTQNGEGSTSATAIVMNTGSDLWGSAAEERGCGTVKIFNPSDATVYTRVSSNLSVFGSSGSQIVTSGAGVRLSAADVDAIQFLFSSGNIESGTFKLYGVVGS